MRKEQRIEYIDFFRGIGILLMLVNHVYFGGVIYNISHAFHMPMFFIISGFLYSKKSKRQLSTQSFIKKKAKSLLLPYVIFGILHYLIWIAIYGFSIEPLTHVFFYNTEEGMPIAGALWFLTALFITDVLFFVMDRYLRNRIVFTSTIVILSMFGTLARIILPFTLPFALSAGFVGLGLFGIGVLLKKVSYSNIYRRFENFKPIYKYSILVFLFILTCCLILLNGAVNMRDGRYSLIPLFWVNATLATVTGLLISKCWFEFKADGIVNSYICSIGKESIVYLCLNQLVIFFVKKVGDIIALTLILNQLIVLFISLIVLYLICRIVFSTKLKILFGK